MDDFEVLDGAEDTIRMLCAAGFFIAVLSNQPDVATGKVDRGFVEAINAQTQVKPGDR